MVSKLQHHVFYVEDLKRSKDFYMQLFDLQFSALNHPDSSAAMKISKQEMHFFSFGFYHHDICMVKHHKLKMDNHSMLHYSMVVHNKNGFEKIQQQAEAMSIPLRKGRMLKSAQMQPDWLAFCFQDPDRHWIEILWKP
ncbi:VOC family protein [Chryseobacterium sp.]|uniref:VOC family protein n=1 Tax=Chryseobacterium sp. TaxID=1871047 RepID=UPI001B219CDC|nr:VOC family protein [Chryseobacterium sp.]MBO9691698.1 VOC family protein [Chryseobacterium sp.]